MDINNPPTITQIKGMNGKIWKPKIIEIGDWNMDVSVTKQVAHEVDTDYKNIQNVQVTIRDDDDLFYYSLFKQIQFLLENIPAGDLKRIDSGYIVLERLAGGFFDGSDFNSISYNRGFVSFWVVK